MWYASSCSGIVMTIGVSSGVVRGIGRMTSIGRVEHAGHADRRLVS